jgi:hypothetical protein
LLFFLTKENCCDQGMLEKIAKRRVEGAGSDGKWDVGGG